MPVIGTVRKLFCATLRRQCLQFPSGNNKHPGGKEEG